MTVLSNKPRDVDHHIIMEATEIELYPNNMSKEDGFCLSKSWKPLTSSQNKFRRHPS
jgi:hypothetical protein